jgi:hypothetical protein
MAFLGETILLPMHSREPPNTFAFFKRIPIPPGTHKLDLPRELKVKVYQNKGPAKLEYLVTRFVESFITKIYRGFVTSTYLSVEYRDSAVMYDFNSENDVIVEIDEAPGRIMNPNLENINEDALVAEIQANPTLGEKIPPILWERSSFLQKITDAKLGRFIPDYVRTTARLKGVNYFGDKTGTFNSPRFPPDVSNSINEFLDVDQSKDTVLPSIIRAKREKERELKEARELPSRELKDKRAESYFSILSRRFGMGGTRRKRRTRRFKK